MPAPFCFSSPEAVWSASERPWLRACWAAHCAEPLGPEPGRGQVRSGRPAGSSPPDESAPRWSSGPDPSGSRHWVREPGWPRGPLTESLRYWPGCRHRPSADGSVPGSGALRRGDARSWEPGTSKAARWLDGRPDGWYPWLAWTVRSRPAPHSGPPPAGRVPRAPTKAGRQQAGPDSRPPGEDDRRLLRRKLGVPTGGRCRSSTAWRGQPRSPGNARQGLGGCRRAGRWGRSRSTDGSSWYSWSHDRTNRGDSSSHTGWASTRTARTRSTTNHSGTTGHS